MIMKQKTKMMTHDGKKQETNGYITNSQCEQFPVGLIAQLVKHCTGITEVMGLNPL